MADRDRMRALADDHNLGFFGAIANAIGGAVTTIGNVGGSVLTTVHNVASSPIGQIATPFIQKALGAEPNWSQAIAGGGAVLGLESGATGSINTILQRTGVLPAARPAPPPQGGAPGSIAVPSIRPPGAPPLAPPPEPLSKQSPFSQWPSTPMFFPAPAPPPAAPPPSAPAPVFVPVPGAAQPSAPTQTPVFLPSPAPSGGGLNLSPGLMIAAAAVLLLALRK